LYDRLIVDLRVQHQFTPARLPSLKAGQVHWFTAVLSGDDPPINLAEAHADVTITDEQVAAVLGHLDDILGEFGVERRLRLATHAVVSRLWHARLI
jgi:hypothetical protein